MQLNHVGGTFGGQRKPTDFICLLCKMLQIQPDKEIVVEFIKNEEYKYVRLLGAFYLRLVGKAIEVYQYLEPLYNDYRKVRRRTSDGSFVLSHVDEIIDEMLRKDYLFDIALPRIPSRMILERSDLLEARISVLAEDFDEAALEAEAGDAAKAVAALEAEMANQNDRDRRRRRRSRSRSRERDRRGHGRDHDYHERDARDHRRSRSHSHERHKDRDMEREREKDRDRKKEKDRQKGKDDRHRRHSPVQDERTKDAKRKRKHNDEDPEIAEANALRAKLGLKPLHIGK